MGQFDFTTGITPNQGLGNDIALMFGDSNDAQILYETADANALALLFGLPHTTEDANNVPVAVFGDLDIVNVDLGFFNGITQPRIAVVDADRDSWVSLGFNSTEDDKAEINKGGSAWLNIQAGGDIPAAATISSGIDCIKGQFEFYPTLTAAQEYRAALFRANYRSTTPGNPVVNDFTGIEGVAASYTTEEAITFRGGHFRTYTNADSTSTMRTAMGLEASARASYSGGTECVAEAGTGFIGARIWMAPYFTSGSIGNLNNFWGLWIYGEHATQRNADSAIKISDAGGGFTADITFQEGTTLTDDGTFLTLAGAHLAMGGSGISDADSIGGRSDADFYVQSVGDYCLYLQGNRPSTNPLKAVAIRTLNGSDVQTERLEITGGLDTVVATWIGITHTGLSISEAEGLHRNVDDSYIRLMGGLDYNSAGIVLWGKSHATYPGQLVLHTTNDSQEVATRLTITGNLATAVATWANITHTGLVLSGDLACGGQDLLNANLLQLDEITTPSALADHGQLYTKNTNKFFFQDGAGSEHEMAKVSELTTHAALTTGTHGVGTGTIASVSTANKSIYVDKDASGAADGTSYTDAFTTIQDAVDSIEDVIIHAYTIYVRDGTKKTGTADENTANHLVDDGNAQFVEADIGKRVFNITDGTWGVVGSYVDAGDLGIIDTAGANLDLFPDGDEEYVIEASPYRERLYFNSSPASYPSHLILGSVNIEAEYYWYGDCDANANAGEIKDTSADFTNVEVGDRVVAIDQTGANTRPVDYEIGTVDDVSQVGSDIVRTTLTKTPTTNWLYIITKCGWSGSDDGTDAGTARSRVIGLNTVDKITFKGFYVDWCDSSWAVYTNSRSCHLNGFIAENNDIGMYVQHKSILTVSYMYSDNVRDVQVLSDSFVDLRDSVLRGSDRGLYIWEQGSVFTQQTFFDQSTDAIYIERFSNVMAYVCGISANCTDGAHGSGNSHAYIVTTTNSATNPENPAATTDGVFIQ